MKEKIFQILNNSKKSLDVVGVIHVIGGDYSYKDIQDVMMCLEELEKEGLVYRTKDNFYMPFERSQMKKGVIEINKAGNGYLLLEDEADLFIPKSNLRGAIDGDTVVCEISRNTGKRLEGRVVRILKKNINQGLCEVQVVDGNYRLIPLNKDAKYHLFLDYNGENIVDGDIVKTSVVKEIGKRDFVVKIDRKLGHKNSPDIDTLIIVEEFGIPYIFSEEALKEAADMPKEITEESKKNRVDLTDETIFTIDGADTKDIDDAVSVKKLSNGNYLLGVYIADVSYYVKENSAIKTEALERGNSYYLADRVIPMLPVELSNGICSLNPNVERLAIGCQMEIDKNGNVVDHDIFEAVIKSRKKMTYENVNKVLKGEKVEGYEEYENDLLTMLELSKILKKMKQRRGEITFISSEIKPVVDENGKYTEIHKRTEGDAERLIEDFMIAANETVASHIYNMDLPFVYRVHDVPTEKNMKDYYTFLSNIGQMPNIKVKTNNIRPKDIQNLMEVLENNKYYPTLNKRMLRSMQKARYDMENFGHFGLASPIYTHFTSPIRRYSDLMVHYFLREYLFEKNITSEFCTKWENELPMICDHISKTERNADSCENEVDSMKIAEYMENHIGDEYKATIDTTMKKGFFVETEELISGFVPLETLDDYFTYLDEMYAYENKKHKIVYRIGDIVDVKCIGASKEERKVDFTLVRKKDGNNKQKS